MMSRIGLIVVGLVLMVSAAMAQSNAPIEPKKANARAATEAPPQAEPFDGASIEKLAGQCVTLDTELGAIEIAMMPENAPESVRNFLNLSATGALDTTTFSRVVKGFVIQGGNLQTSE
ncbi:MAG TPA: peptidylprolyl isomerase, partial [Pyrinomonadaceae bacterium]